MGGVISVLRIFSKRPPLEAMAPTKKAPAGKSPFLSGPKKTPEQLKAQKASLRNITSPFPKFVEIGRVALIKGGPDAGKIVAIVDIVDAKHYLADGPGSGVTRCVVAAANIHLTKFVIKFPRGGSTKVVRQSWTASGLQEKWEHSKLAKKLSDEKKREGMNDLDRFKVYKAKQARNRILKRQYFVLRKKARKSGVFAPKALRIAVKGKSTKKAK